MCLDSTWIYSSVKSMRPTLICGKNNRTLRIVFLTEKGLEREPQPGYEADGVYSVFKISSI